jgi:hypothetical protein
VAPGLDGLRAGLVAGRSGPSWAGLRLGPRWVAGVEGGNNTLKELLKRLVGQKLKGGWRKKSGVASQTSGDWG